MQKQNHKKKCKIREMAQSIKWLAHKHEDLSVDPQPPCKSCHVQQCLPAILEWGRLRQKDLWSSEQVSLLELVISNSLRKLVLKKKAGSNRETYLKLTSDLYMHTNKHLHMHYTHIQINTHINTHTSTHTHIRNGDLSESIENVENIKEFLNF